MKYLRIKPTDLAGLTQFKIPIQKISELKALPISTNEAIYYREFPNDCENFVLILHGMGGDSRYLTQLATCLADSKRFHVVTPDLPFHGPKAWSKEVKLSDPHYVLHQIDFILENLANGKKFKNIFVIGHSLGAAILLKWLEEKLNPNVKDVLLVAPYLSKPYFIETDLFSQWVRKEEDFFHLLIDPKLRIGTEVESYHQSYLQGCISESLDLNKIVEKVNSLNILISEDDLIISAENIKKYFKDDHRVNLIIEKGLSHLGLLTSPEQTEKIKELMLQWL